MNNKQVNILVVDDELDIRQLVKEILQDEGYSVYSAGNAEEARRLKLLYDFDLILLDIWMPDIDGISLLKEWHDETDFISPVVMMSGHGTIDSAVEAIKLGAYEFLEKPLSLAQLLLVVERAIGVQQLKGEHILEKSHYIECEPVGHSLFVTRLKEQLILLAKHDTHVVFTGESGVGKALYARFLHAHSHRAAAKFITISMAGMRADTANEIFFGSERDGEVTLGLLEQAQGGTLFMSEIATMNKAMQLNLLNALDSGFFYRVGGKQLIAVDVRIIIATDKGLHAHVASGKLSENLYHLLNQVMMAIVPLREHSEDIPELLAFYVNFFIQHEKLTFRKFSISAQNFLRNYAWFGNVRELKNLVHKLMILGVGNEIDLLEVKTALGDNLTKVVVTAAENEPDFFNLPLKEARESFERAYLEYHFGKHKGNVAKLAAAVGVERTHLYRKLHALNIKE